MTANANGRTVVEVTLPQLGESVAEGTVTTWFKGEGSAVSEDEPLCEISTDKVNTDIPAPRSGEVVELVAEEGETVEVGGVLARIAIAESEAGESGGFEQDGGREGAGGSADADRPHFEDSSISLWGGSGSSGTDAAGDAGGSGPTSVSPDAREATDDHGDTPRYSPAVKALARQEDLDLEKVDGTGRDGRVTRDDVRRYLRTEKGGTGSDRPDGELREKLSPVRRVIAERLSKSKAEIPHSTTVMEADLSEVAGLRDRERATLEEREDVPLTYLPFVAFATLRALREHPRMNAVFKGDAVRVRRKVNLGVAVATKEGLLVPVVPEAVDLGFLELARALNRVAKSARSGTLEPEDVQGGTFTITNHGRGGSLLGTPIIVPGQTGILGVGKIQDKPVAVEGEVAVRKQCYLSLSFDHRVVDGAQADAFLRTIVEGLGAFDDSALRG